MHIDGSKSSGQTLSQLAPPDLGRRSCLKIEFHGLTCFWWLWHGLPWKFWLQRYPCSFAWNIHTKRWFALNSDIVFAPQAIDSAEDSFAMPFISYNMSNLEITWTTRRMGTFFEVVQNRRPMVWMEKHFRLCVRVCAVSNGLQASSTSCRSRVIR